VPGVIAAWTRVILPLLPRMFIKICATFGDFASPVQEARAGELEPLRHFQLATNSFDVSERSSTAAAVLPKNNVSPGRRFAPSTIRSSLRLASLITASSGAKSPRMLRRTLPDFVPVRQSGDILQHRFIVAPGSAVNPVAGAFAQAHDKTGRLWMVEADERSQSDEASDPRSLMRRLIEAGNLRLGFFAQTMLIGAHAGRGAEPHVPVAVNDEAEASSAMVASRLHKLRLEAPVDGAK
jgi:hypothetical protein